MNKDHHRLARVNNLQADWKALQPPNKQTITAMGQARADSVPMLVISGVNATDTLGKGLGFLHELPDQRGMMEKVALFSERITEAPS